MSTHANLYVHHANLHGKFAYPPLQTGCKFASNLHTYGFKTKQKPIKNHNVFFSFRKLLLQFQLLFQIMSYFSSVSGVTFHHCCSNGWLKGQQKVSKNKGLREKNNKLGQAIIFLSQEPYPERSTLGSHG